MSHVILAMHDFIVGHRLILTTLAPGEESEGNAFRSVCLSVRMCISKTVAPIDLIFFTQEVLYPWLGLSSMIALSIEYSCHLSNKSSLL